jgi:acyl-CoA synthetase (AMP-forming)/AMP-acid ligase II/acyl carrier protein
MSFATLTQALDNNLSESSTINYLTGNNEESDVTFKDLRQRALGILFHLQQKNIKLGDQLIIHTDNNEFFLDVFWAGLYGGIIPVPVATANNDEHRLKLIRIFKKLESPWLYTDKKTLDKILSFCKTNNMLTEAKQFSHKSILIDDIEDISTPGKIFPVKPDDIAFIQFSSGSTSEPKGVVLTHKNILTNIHAIIEAAKITQNDSTFSWMPLTHDMGMIGFHLTPVVLGLNHSIMDTSVFVRRPLLWLIMASKKQSTLLCSPNFGYKLFLKIYQSKGIETIDLSRVRLIFNGAEPISIELCHQFLNAMASHGLKSNTMYPVYGLAEASLAVSFPRPEDEIESIKLKRSQLAVADTIKTGVDDAVDFIFVGKPVNNCHVRICDLNNNPLKDNTVGKIQLKGDSITSGYYHADEINKQLITADGWLDTGDLGAFVNGQMIITGRIKDIIFINGLNFYSHDIENILHNLAQLELGKVVASSARKAESNDEELIIFILYRSAIESFIPLLKTVRKAINKTTGIEINHVIPVKRIPKTTSGKIQRHLLSDEYIAGEYDTVIHDINALINQEKNDTINTVNKIEKSANVVSLESRILQICRSGAPKKNINPDDNLFEIGISSLVLADIHEQLDEAFPGEIDISDLFDNPSVSELAKFLQSKVGQ